MDYCLIEAYCDFVRVMSLSRDPTTRFQTPDRNRQEPTFPMVQSNDLTHLYA